MTANHAFQLAWALILLFGVIPAIVVTIAVLRRKFAARIVADEKRDADIPLIAGMLSLKGRSWLILAFNYWRPLLVLSRDSFTYRVWRSRNRRYGDVSLVEFRRTAIGTRNVVVEFADSLFSYVAHAPNDNIAAETIRVFGTKGCPLSARARRIAGLGNGAGSASAA